MNGHTFLQLFNGAVILCSVFTIVESSLFEITDSQKRQSVKSSRISHDLFSNDEAKEELLHRAVGTMAKSLFDTHLSQNKKNGIFNETSSSFRMLQQNQRQLGDFDAFNALFRGTTIILPDALNLYAGAYLWYEVYLDLTQIRCRDLAVDNIVVSHNKVSNQKLDLRIQLIGVKLKCNLNIGFRQEGWGGFGGSGTGEAETQNSSADTIIEFISDGFDYHPPKDSNLGPCNSNVELGDFSLGGSNVFFNIANLFKSLFKSRVESEIEDVLCEELGSLGADSLEELLKLLNERIETYMQPLPPELTNPLHAENNLAVPDEVQLMNFQEPDDNSLTKWFVESIDQISDFLGSRQADSSSPTGEDLGVNILMRSLLLNDNREYIIPFADWPFGDGNGLIFDVHDRMTKTTMQLTNARIIGLDTMTHVDPLNIIGKYTIKNHLSWKELILEVDITLRILGSTLPDSIFDSSNGEEVVENIKVKIGLDDLNVDFHFLLALDNLKWKNLHLAQILQTEKIISCLIDTVHRAEITGLSVSTTNIHEPTLSGFISNGIDRVIKSIVDASFVMYEEVFKRAMPNLFQTEVREILNNMTNDLTKDKSENECVPYSKTGESKAVDFRDLLLDPEEAKARGAVGDGRYGDVAQTIKKLIEDELLANDPEASEDTPLANRVVIQPFTKSQSGIEGTLRFNDTLIDMNIENINDPIGSAIAEKLQLQVSDFRLSNLDTLHHPIKILDPQNKPTTLYNQANLGERRNDNNNRILSESSPHQIKGSTRLLLDLEGDGSPFEMRNDVDLSIIMPRVEGIAAFKIFIIEDNFMSMRLENMLNLNCWLAMIPGRALDVDGFPIDKSIDPAVQLSQLLIALSDLQIKMDCISCSSTGLDEVSEVFQIIHNSGAMSELRSRLVTFASEVMQGPWLHTQISRELSHAPKQCPGNPAYIENYEAPEYSSLPFPALSDESMEMFILSGVMLSEVAMVVVAESHSKMGRNTTSDPLSAQKSVSVPTNITLIDFANMNSTFGGLADVAISELRSLVNRSTEDANGPKAPENDLGINVQLRSLLLDDNRTLAIDIDDASFSFGEATVELKQLRLNGLDTFKSIDILDIIASQTILNNFLIETINVELDMMIDTEDDAKGPEMMTVKAGLKDVNMSVGVFLAINEDALGDLELGSLLHMENILPCLLSSLYHFEVTQLTVSVSDIEEPTFDGYISPKIKEVITTSIQMIFQRYKATMIGSMPAFFDITIRKFINNLVLNYINENNLEKNNTSRCNLFSKTGESKAVDFRDLLLDPEEAKARGAVGDGRYGDVAQTIKKLIEDELLANDPEASEDTPLANRVVIQPFTKSQSGIEGTLRFNDTLIDMNIENINDPIGSAIAEKLQLQVSDFRLSNLDTLHHPIKILDPQNKPTTLYNQANLGERRNDNNNRILSESSPHQIKGSTRLLLDLEGDGSPFEMRNDVDLSIIMPRVEGIAAFKIFIIEDNFMSMRLENMLNLNCWLAMLPGRALDVDGFPIDKSIDPAVQLSQLLIALSDLQIKMDCISCSSTGLDEVSEVFQIIHNSGAMSELRSRLVTFASEVMQGPWLHTQISRELSHAPKQCPGNPAYIENYEAPEYSSLPFPALSDESMEMFILSGVMLSEVAMVVVAESHSKMGRNTTSDPLSAQKSVSVPTNITLIDFANMNSTFGGLADVAISELRSLVNRSTEDANGPKAPENDLGINVQLRSLLLDDNRTLAIDIDDVSFSFGESTVELKQLRLNGLDTFKSIDILDIIASQTILNNFLIETINVELDMMIDTEDDAKGPEMMTVKAGLKDVNMSVGVFLAINEDALGDLELGSLLHMENILPCLLSSLYHFEVTQLTVSVSDIEEPTFDGYISPKTKEVISTSIQMIFQRYKATMIGSMPAFFDITIRKSLNRLIQNQIDISNSNCPSTPLTSRQFMNFGDLLLSEYDSLEVDGLGTSPYGDVARSLMDLIEDTILKIDPVDGTSAINDALIRGLTEAQSNVPGTLILAGDVFGTKSNLDIGGLKGVLEFRASDARIVNLDTVGQPLKLLDPVEPHVLNNTATLGVGTKELRAAVSLVIAFEDENHSLRNKFDMSLSIKSAQVVLAVLIKMSEKLVLRFPMRDILNMHCWLATIPAPLLDSQGVRISKFDLTAAIQNIAVAISQIRLNINCTDCSSPGMHQFASHLSSPDAVRSVTDVANNLFEYFTSLMGGKFLQVQIDRLLNEAPSKCPHNIKYDASTSAVVYQPFSAPEKTNDPLGFLFVISGVCASVICIFFILVVSVRRIRQKRHKQWIQTLSKEDVIQIHKTQTIEKKREEKLNSSTTCMILSPAIPIFIRYAMPIVLLGNIGFFLSGHLSLGASVNIKANIAGDIINIEKFFEFSMARSTLDMWNAGAKTLAILIGLFSGAWPYTKQLITLFLWVAPPKFVSVSRRESIFLWLDRLAKWSIVDIFVLLMSVAAFNISVNSPENVPFLPPKLYSLKLMVVPLWGMYANMTAQLLSQISSHIIIHYHRIIVAEALGDGYCGGRIGIKNRNESKFVDTVFVDNESSPTSMTCEDNQNHIGALCNHRFDRDGIKKGISLYVRSWVNYAIVVLAVVFIILVICGCAIPSFSLEVLGIIGLVVESGQDFKQAITRYSVFNIVELLSSQSKDLETVADTIGLGSLSFILILSVLIVPILQVVLYLARWFRPLTRGSQIRVFVTLEVLDAWQYIEVYILSVAVAAWQLGGVSEFMINSFCGSLEDTFASLAFYGIISDEDAQCFRVNPRVQSGLWLLMAASMVLAFMNHFISKAASQQERDISINDFEDESEVTEIQERELDDSSDDVSASENNFDNEMNDSSSTLDIKPTALHFTDYYRWFLYKYIAPVEESIEVGNADPFDPNKSIYSISNTAEISVSSDRSASST